MAALHAASCLRKIRLDAWQTCRQAWRSDSKVDQRSRHGGDEGGRADMNGKERAIGECGEHDGKEREQVGRETEGRRWTYV